MDTNLRIEEPSEASVGDESSDCSPGKSNPSTAGPPDDPTRSDSAQQPQPQVTVFPLFQRLPAELRVLVWEFACAPTGPRIHFLEPIDDPHDEWPAVFWHQSRRRWRQDYCWGSDRTPIFHWEIRERTDDPLLQWHGRELLSVCIEARRVSLDRKATSLASHRAQSPIELSDMVQATDIICIRAGFAAQGLFIFLPISGFGDKETGYCYRDERPSPRRLALEIPIAAESPRCYGHFQILMPHWLGHYNNQQKFMHFDRLEIVYVLAHHIKPRAHYDHQQVMPPEMYTEAFDGHHGSRFVAIDPEDNQAVQLWIIPEHCWKILECVRPFPDFFSRRVSDDSHPKAKLRFLACVRESSQVQQLDDESPNSGFAFT